jgi:uncharacterized protein (TIGR00252 family)
MKVNHKQQSISPQRKPVVSLAWRQSLGKAGEQYVANLLHHKGWQVIERNWHAGRYAEIDIIAYDPERTLVFIEVKTRMRIATKVGFDNSGYEKLDKRKAHKLLGCARIYMAQHVAYKKQTNLGCRFDAFVLYYPALEQNNLIDSLSRIKEIEPEVHHIKGFLP